MFLVVEKKNLLFQCFNAIDETCQIKAALLHSMTKNRYCTFHFFGPIYLVCMYLRVVYQLICGVKTSASAVWIRFKDNTFLFWLWTQPYMCSQWAKGPVPQLNVVEFAAIRIKHRYFCSNSGMLVFWSLAEHVNLKRELFSRCWITVNPTDV